MKVRDWQDVLESVVERDVDPKGWRAIAGHRARGVGEDLYLAHPRGGVYLVKTYAKNPFQVRGVGTKVARKLDDEIGSFLPEPDEERRFAVQRPPTDEEEAKQKATRVEEVVKTHAEAPTTPGDLFEDVMEAIESPAFGPLEYRTNDRPEGLDELSDRFEDAEELLTAELDDLIQTDEVDRGFQ